jgi:hypothetical protein
MEPGTSGPYLIWWCPQILDGHMRHLGDAHRAWRGATGIWKRSQFAKFGGLRRQDLSHISTFGVVGQRIIFGPHPSRRKSG